MRNLIPFAVIIAGAVAAAGVGIAATSADLSGGISSANAPANQLLKTVVENELAADKNDTSLWMYNSDIRKSGEDTEEKVVETAKGILTRRISVNGKPLSKEEEKEEEAQLHKLLSDSSDAMKAQEAQSHDADQAEDMLRLLPRALTAKYGKRRDELQALLFQPNRDFRPSTHEAEVFQAMSGTMWVNTRENRLAEMDGHLSHRVNFGWGILGHLDQGGTFHVVQAEVVPGHWEIVKLVVNMRGKALFFKSISVQQNETRSDYKLLPPNLSLAEGVKLLEK